MQPATRLVPSLSLSPVLRVNGAALDGYPLAHLRSMRIERGLREIGRATLRYDDEGLQLASGGAMDLGAAIEISLISDAGVAAGTIFSGVVTAASVDFEGPRSPQLTVIADDAAVKLTRGTKTATFTTMTLGDVVSTLVREAGLQGDVTSPISEQFAYLIQSGSALQFIDDIAQRYGVDWHVDSSSTFIFGGSPPSSASGTFEIGDNLTSLSVRASGLGPTQVAADGWNPARKAALGPSTAPVSSAPSSRNTAMSGFRAGSALGASEYVSSAASPTSGVDAEALADSMAERAASSSLIARGEVAHVANIEPGCLITIAGAGPANGDYRVSRVEHILTGAGMTTRFTAGDPRPSTLVETLSSRRRDSFSHTGLLSGVVTNNADPDGMGRVQVMFGGIQTQDTSAWARIATPGAGSERGLVILPEIGDEVLVGFEQGDILRPVVLGGLFNGNARMGSYGLAPNAGSSGGQVAQRSLISRKGHRMQIADGEAPADNGVTMALTAGTDHMMRLGKDKMQVVLPAGVPLEITAGSNAGITIDAQGNVTIRGNKVTISADTDVAIAAKGGKAEVTASAGQLALSGMTFAVKASATGEINGGGSLTAKAGTVMIN